MTRFVVCGVLAVSVWFAAGVAAQQPPVIRSRSEIVRVFVTVTDRDGHLVTNLAQNDFEARDDGKAQPVAVFDNSPKPIELITLLDVSGSMHGNLPLMRAASEQLFMRLGPDDVARLGTFGRSIDISPEFTHDANALLSSLPREIEPDAPTPLWTAVGEAMSLFKDDPAEKRRIVLVLTDGQDSGPTSLKKKWVSPAEVIDRARAEDVMIYAVGMQSRNDRPRQIGLGPDALKQALSQDLPDPSLAKVAEESGGGYSEIRYGQDLAGAFTRVADEIHSQYLLGYTPPKRDGKVHHIDVRVSKSGMKPRARKSYVAPSDK